MQYRPEIDGLRAIAVLPVILFHGGISLFSGGYVGVDIFFVISGYLITTIIFEEIRNDDFKISNFYERRIRRILPALFLVIVACLPFAWVMMTPDELKQFAQSIVAVVTFTANIEFWQESGYFAPAAELSPLLHTWSLAVEEQYYLFFPVLVLLLWKYKKSLILPCLCLILLISLALAQWSSTHYPSANFYLIHTRLWELMLGSVIALLAKPKVAVGANNTSPSAKNEWLGLTGILLILYAIFFFDSSTPFPSLYTLVPTLGTALIIRYSSPNTLAGRLLSLKPMVGIGLISYSAYLWHQPLFAFAKLRALEEPPTGLMMLLATLSLVLAYLSWRYVEGLFRDRKRISREQIFRYAKIASFILICIGVTGSLSKGFPNRMTAAGVSMGELEDRLDDNHGFGEECANALNPAPECRTDEAPEILVWGDSYAMHLIQGIMASNPKAKIIQLTRASCSPLLTAAPLWTGAGGLSGTKACLEHNQQVANWVRNNHSLKYAVIASPFSYLIRDKGEFYKADGETVPASPETGKALLEETLEFLVQRGIKPVIFSPMPGNGKDIGLCLLNSSISNRNPSKDCGYNQTEIQPSILAVYAFLEQFRASYPVIRIDHGVCPDEHCSVMMNNKFLYTDTGHISPEGSAELGKTMNFYELITKQ